MSASAPPRSGPIVIHGAGSIGGYVGLAWQHEGADVRLLGRPWLAAAAQEHAGLTLSDCHGRSATIPVEKLSISSDPAILAEAGLVVLAIKATALDTAIAELRAHCPVATPILSLQNGLGPLEQLRAQLPNHKIMGGVVTHNVVIIGGNRFHKATAGAVIVEASPDLGLLDAVAASVFAPVSFREDFPAARWGKLLINLNNAVNAVSGLGLRAQFSESYWRKTTAAAIREGITVARAEGIVPAQAGMISPHRFAMLLAMPQWLFRIVATKMLRSIDESARSSMADDITAGKPTEIAFLNGAIAALGKRHGIATPINDWLVASIAELGSRDCS